MGNCAGRLDKSSCQTSDCKNISLSLSKLDFLQDSTFKTDAPLLKNNYQFTNNRNTVNSKSYRSFHNTATHSSRIHFNQTNNHFNSLTPSTTFQIASNNYSTESKRLNSFNDQSSKVFIALYDYEARTVEDLSFHKGDLLTIINDTLGEWWLARLKNPNESHLKQEGYVPSNYITPFNSLETDESVNYFTI